MGRARNWLCNQPGFMPQGLAPHLGPLSPQAAVVEHMGPVSWKHIKFKAVLVIGSVMFIPPPVDATLAEATDNHLCFYCQLQ